jgi:hypothetical protein
MKTSELTGAALDWAVAQCEGEEVSVIRGQLETRWTDNGWKPSTDWAQAGPIIEREKIALRYEPKCDWLFVPPQATWLANYEGVGEWDGPTPLIAAMRCYVAACLGDEIELPEELK